MKVSELAGAQLDYWVARANGSRAVDLKIGPSPRNPEQIVCIENDPSGFAWIVFAPSTDWSQGGPLMEKYRIDTEKMSKAWLAFFSNKSEAPVVAEGSTPLQAICRAVVRAKFGDEVDGIRESAAHLSAQS